MKRTMHAMMCSLLPRRIPWEGIGPAFFSVLGLIVYSYGLFHEPDPIRAQNKAQDPGPYKKAVIFLIDGLRTDAVHAVLPECSTRYHANFPFLETLPADCMFKSAAVADFPTGTTMRVYSMFSGVPTTLLGAQNSFNGHVCRVDNLILQLEAHGKSVAFFGDETWIQTFPSLKTHKAVTYSPFGLVTEKKEKSISDAFVAAIGKYDCVICHLISPDSYGHVFTTDSPEVQRKLRIMNEILEKVCGRMDEDTVCLVLSDHGVNNDGSHGGTSLAERASTAIFIAHGLVQTKNPVMSVISKNVSGTITATTSGSREVAREFQDAFSKLFCLSENLNVISQNDILPSVCALIGLPTPYNSPGTLVPEIIPLEYTHLYLTEIKRKKHALQVLKGIEVPTILDSDSTPQMNLGEAQHIRDQLIAENDRLGKEIHSMYNAKSVAKMAWGILFLAAALGICMWSSGISALSIPMLISYLTVFMVAHSVHCIIQEDIISSLILVLLASTSGRDVSYLLRLPLLLVSGSFPLHDVDRIRYIRWIRKINVTANTPALAWLCFFAALALVANWCFHAVHALFYRVHREGKPLEHSRWVRACLSKHSYIPTMPGRPVRAVCTLVALQKLFSNGHTPAHAKILLVCVPECLVSLLYTPSSALALIHGLLPMSRAIASRAEDSPKRICRSLKACTLFFLLKTSFFSIGHNHRLSTINWEAAFLFSDRPLPFISAGLVVCDLILPYLCVFSCMDSGDRREILRHLVLLQTLSVMLCCIVNIWFLNQTLLWIMFAGRTLFECFYLLVLYAAYFLSTCKGGA